MEQEICWLSATELAEGIRNKRFSSQEVVQAHLDRIAALNPTLNAIVTFAADPWPSPRKPTPHRPRR